MILKDTGIYRSGTSGLVIPVPNKAAFPPEFRDKSRLTYYSSLFSSIEINSSFYKVPMASTVYKWAQSVPDDFKFTFKLWKEITHVKGLTANLETIDSFLQVIEQAGDKKGCLLVQFPASVTINNASQVKKIIHRVRKTDSRKEWQTALEFRHPSWYTDDIYSLADTLDMSIVLHDIPASRNMKINAEAGFVYLRFHGPLGDYRGSYTDDTLKSYSVKIKAWLGEGKDVYVYFNNTIGDAITNIVTLNNLMNA